MFSLNICKSSILRNHCKTVELLRENEQTKKSPGIVMYVCNPSTQEAKGTKITSWRPASTT